MDAIQERLASYAHGLRAADIPPTTLHAARVRVIDTLGALIGGFFGEASQIARRLALRTPQPGGATVIGTGARTTPDLAAFANGVMVRYLDGNDGFNLERIDVVLHQIRKGQSFSERHGRV